MTPDPVRGGGCVECMLNGQSAAVDPDLDCCSYNGNLGYHGDGVLMPQMHKERGHLLHRSDRNVSFRTLPSLGTSSLLHIVESMLKIMCR